MSANTFKVRRVEGKDPRRFPTIASAPTRELARAAAEDWHRRRIGLLPTAASGPVPVGDCDLVTVMGGGQASQFLLVPEGAELPARLPGVEPDPEPVVVGPNGPVAAAPEAPASTPEATAAAEPSALARSDASAGPAKDVSPPAGANASVEVLDDPSKAEPDEG